MNTGEKTYISHTLQKFYFTEFFIYCSDSFVVQFYVIFAQKIEINLNSEYICAKFFRQRFDEVITLYYNYLQPCHGKLQRVEGDVKMAPRFTEEPHRSSSVIVRTS